MINKILKSIKIFNLSLNNKNILTEAASGNYVVTPIIAALAGAKVTAVVKSTKYGTAREIKSQIFKLANKLNIKKNIRVVTKKEKIDFSHFDVVTNTGHVRPINKKMIRKLKKNCVIPLMWETWEYRKQDIDLDACLKRGIKVYGTNEADFRLRTFEYTGFTTLSLLLQNKYSPFSTKVLILGDNKFSKPVLKILRLNNYSCTHISKFNGVSPDINKYDVIIVSEHSRNNLLIGSKGFIKPNKIKPENYIIHICGNVDFKKVKCKVTPKQPAKFGYMSYTADYIDNKAVIDLHTAGLKVAEGMIKGNEMSLNKKKFKKYMIKNYPAMPFAKKKYW
jgi:hypothetical protein